MTVIPGAQFKDCQSGDFEHYFVKTILLWNLSPTKKRIFICEGISGDQIMGNYLTRQRELKPKSFLLSSWWQSLDILPPYGRTFNLGKSAAAWYPSMSKNLKKSYPGSVETIQTGVTFFGKPSAEEITVQNILASAFSQYYSPMPVPSLRDAFNFNWSAVATKGDIVVNFTASKVYLKTQVMGSITATKKIVVNSPLAAELLIDIGQISPDRVTVQ
jgi:hypothetical protein